VDRADLATGVADRDRETAVSGAQTVQPVVDHAGPLEVPLERGLGEGRSGRERSRDYDENRDQREDASNR
jgi:hypothetical protein